MVVTLSIIGGRKKHLQAVSLIFEHHPHHDIPSYNTTTWFSTVRGISQEFHFSDLVIFVTKKQHSIEDGKGML
jgi:hypothetical protein